MRSMAESSIFSKTNPAEYPGLDDVAQTCAHLHHCSEIFLRKVSFRTTLFAPATASAIDCKALLTQAFPTAQSQFLVFASDLTSWTKRLVRSFRTQQVQIFLGAGSLLKGGCHPTLQRTTRASKPNGIVSFSFLAPLEVKLSNWTPHIGASSQ